MFDFFILAETPLVREVFMAGLDVMGIWPLLSSRTISLEVVLLGSVVRFILIFYDKNFILNISALKAKS
jgi:hypothetical protein